MRSTTRIFCRTSGRERPRPDRSTGQELSDPRVTMADMARLGVGPGAGGPPAGAGRAHRRARARRERPRRRRPARRRRRRGQVAADRRGRGARRGRRVHRARRPLPRHRRVVAALPAVHRGRRPARHRTRRAGPGHPADCAGCCPAASPAGRAARGPRAGPAAGVRRGALRALRAGLRGAGPARRGGPALGRPLQPRPAGVPAVPARRPAARSCWPPTAATICTGATRCGRCCPSWSGCRRSSGWTLAPARPQDTLELVGARRRAACPSAMLHRVARRSEGNAFFAEELVSAARAPTGCPARARRGAAGPRRAALAATDAACAAPRGRRRAAGAPRPPRRGVRARRRRAGAGAARGRRPPRAGARAPAADTADDAYASATRCCATPSTTTCCPASAAACTPPMPGCSPSRRSPAGRRARPAPPSSPTTPSPATICRCALAASVQAADEANDRQAPAEVLLHAERAMEPVARRARRRGGGRRSPRAPSPAGPRGPPSATGDPDRGIALGRRALELAEQRGDPHLVRAIARPLRLRLLDLSGREHEALEAAPSARSSSSRASRRRATLAWAHAVLAGR